MRTMRAILTVALITVSTITPFTLAEAGGGKRVERRGSMSTQPTTVAPNGGSGVSVPPTNVAPSGVAKDKDLQSRDKLGNFEIQGLMSNFNEAQPLK